MYDEARDGGNDFPALPAFEESSSLDARLVHYGVSITLVLLVVGVASALVVLFTFHMEITVEARGFLELENLWRIHSRTSGVVQEVLVRPGDSVREHQVLVRLDSFELARHLEKLRLEAEQKRPGPETSRGERQLLEQEILVTEERIRRMQMTAPANGIVLTEGIEKLVGSHVGEGELLFEIGSADGWKAELLVAANDVHRIELGHRVRVKVPEATAVGSWVADSLFGRVTFVGSEPAADGPSSGRMYKIFAVLDPQQIGEDERRRFKRGMAVEGQVITRSARAIDALVFYLREKLGLSG